jgi:hypothetical protein
MKDNARKYILKTSEIISCGIGTNYTNVTCNSLLNSFTLDDVNTCCICCINTSTCGCEVINSYPAITTEQLSSLSVIDYDRRVIDFLDNFQIESEITKENLFNNASYYNPTYYAELNLLNSDFIVYKIFDNGIRIINAGQANGILEYRVSGVTYNSGWQTNPSFFGLDYNKIYNFEIRDFYNNIEIYKYSKLVSLNYILASTTTTLPIKTIKLTQTGTYKNNAYCSKYGVITVTPPLIVGETITLNILANALTIGNGGSSSIFFNCDTTTTPFCKINSYEVEKVGELTYSYGTTLKYTIQANCGTYGSQSTANFCLKTINGYGTFTPTIDSTSCSVNITVNVQPLNITMSFGTPTSKISTTTDCVICGSFIMSPVIPAGECINIHLTGINPVQGGTSTTYIICKPSGGIETPIVTLNSSSLQFPIVNMKYGDIMKYCMLLNVPSAGYCASGILNLICGDGSIGVNPSVTIATSSTCCYCSCSDVGSCCINKTINIPNVPISIALCALAGGNNSENGNITITPAMTYATQYATVIYNLTQASVWGGSSTFTLNCKPKGSANYVQKILHTTTSVNGENNTNTFTGSFTINQGDAFTYCTLVYGNNCSCSDFCMTSVLGSIGIIPSINSTKYRSCRSLYTAPVSKVVSLCSINGCIGWEAGCFCITPVMSNNCQSIDIYYKLTEFVNNGTNTVNICCASSSSGCSIPVIKCTHTLTNSNTYGNNYTGCIRVCCGDILTYFMCTTGQAGSCNDLCICKLTSSPDITATISSTCWRKCYVKS